MLKFTVDQEIFMLKIICVKYFHADKFLWFVQYALTVDGYIMDERLEHS